MSHLIEIICIDYCPFYMRLQTNILIHQTITWILITDNMVALPLKFSLFCRLVLARIKPLFYTDRQTDRRFVKYAVCRSQRQYPTKSLLLEILQYSL